MTSKWWSRANRFGALVLSTAGLTLGTGVACPPTPSPEPNVTPEPNVVVVPQPTVLFQQSLQVDVNYVPSICFSGFLSSFNTTSAGKTITITVVGPSSSSRPIVLAFDTNFNTIGKSDLVPVTSTAVASFNSLLAGPVPFAVEECANAGFQTGSYNVTITQSP